MLLLKQVWVGQPQKTARFCTYIASKMSSTSQSTLKKQWKSEMIAFIHGFSKNDS